MISSEYDEILILGQRTS